MKQKNQLDLLISQLLKKDLFESEFYFYLNQILPKEYDFSVEDLNLLGLAIKEKNFNYRLKTKKTLIQNEVFCIVDIETTSSSPKDANIIEIAAIKFLNNTKIDTFETLVHAPKIPQEIQNLTNINEEMLLNAPNVTEVLHKFRIFLKDSIFVAHNVNFDFNFISTKYEQMQSFPLLNRKICTFELAQRCIVSQKYGLDFLKEKYNIQANRHRALGDVIIAGEIFKHCLDSLPSEIKTTEDLISYSKTAPKLKIVEKKEDE